MSEAHRRSQTHRGQQRTQRVEPYRPTGPTDIDPGQAVEYRRRLDDQGSAELIPTSGPDAQADQGPAIKAVWEPEPPGESASGAGPGSRRQARRTGPSRTGSGHPPGRAPRSKRRRHALIFSGAAAVAVAAVGIAGFSGGNAPDKGSAATLMPAASSSSAGGAAAGQSTGSDAGGAAQTSSVSASASSSHTSSATRRASSTGSVRASATHSTATRSASAKASPSKTTCFLFFCG